MVRSWFGFSLSHSLCLFVLSLYHLWDVLSCIAEKWLRWMCVETYFTITASRLLYPAAPRSHAHSYSRRWVLAWPPASFPGKILTPAFRGVCSQGPISNEAAHFYCEVLCLYVSDAHTLAGLRLFARLRLVQSSCLWETEKCYTNKQIYQWWVTIK